MYPQYVSAMVTAICVIQRLVSVTVVPKVYLEIIVKCKWMCHVSGTLIDSLQHVGMQLNLGVAHYCYNEARDLLR